MVKGSNPLAIQSKKWLTQSLVDLMKEKHYKEITIKEISKKADLDRRTFYRNFTSKEDVLNYHIKTLSEEYIQRLSSEKKRTVYIISKVYFEFCLQHIDFFRSLKENDLLVFLLNKYGEYLPHIHGLFENEFLGIDEENIGYALFFNAGGFWNVMVKWISDGASKTPEEMASIVNNLLVGKKN